MNFFRIFRLFSTPSLLSAIFTFFVAVILVLYHIWPYLTYDERVYDFLYGSFGVITALEHYPSLVTDFIKSIAESPIIYTLTIIIAASVAGTIAFFILRSLRRVIQAVAHSTERKEEEIRLAMQTIALVLWASYCFLFVQVFLPAALLLTRIGADIATTFTGIGFICCGFIIILLMVHLHIIFARYTFMKPRLFGSAQSIDNSVFFR